MAQSGIKPPDAGSRKSSNTSSQQPQEAEESEAMASGDSELRQVWRTAMSYVMPVRTIRIYKR
jgi:hypothetical protein